MPCASLAQGTRQVCALPPAGPMDHPNGRRNNRRNAPAQRRDVPARAADEAEFDVDHDESVYEVREHDTEFDGDDEHAPQHATGRADATASRRAARR
jgi:hypothetical protein